jgi:hypothetical protein
MFIVASIVCCRLIHQDARCTYVPTVCSINSLLSQYCKASDFFANFYVLGGGGQLFALPRLSHGQRPALMIIITNLHLPAELLSVGPISLLALAHSWAEQLAYITSQFHEENATVCNTAGGAPRASVRRLCEGFLYLRNTIRFYPTQASVVSVTAIRKVRPFLHRFMLVINTRRYCVQISQCRLSPKSGNTCGNCIRNSHLYEACQRYHIFIDDLPFEVQCGSTS